MATHSSILAWKVPWTEEPGGLQSIWLHRVRPTQHTCNNNKLMYRILANIFIFYTPILTLDIDVYRHSHKLFTKAGGLQDTFHPFEVFLLPNLCLHSVPFTSLIDVNNLTTSDHLK